MSTNDPLRPYDNYGVAPFAIYIADIAVHAHVVSRSYEETGQIAQCLLSDTHVYDCQGGRFVYPRSCILEQGLGGQTSKAPAVLQMRLSECQAIAPDDVNPAIRLYN